MVYRKRTYRRRRPYKKNYRKRSLASKAYYLAKKASKMPELKFADITGTITAPDNSTNTQIQDLSNIAQGTTNQTRIGDTIHPTSVQVKGNMNIHASATATRVRVICFVWRGVETAPVVSNIISSAADINSFKADGTRYLSKIMYDRVYSLNAVNRPELQFQFKCPLSKVAKFISYRDTTATANHNAIYVLIISDEATNVPTLAYNSRLYFRDP